MTTSKIPVKMLNPEGTGIITNILKVAAGSNHTVLLSEDGKIYSAGYNGYGALAIGNTTNKSLVVAAKDSSKAQITDAVDIVAKHHSTTILRKDGSIYTAGYNGYGQAANKTTTANKVFTKMLGEYGEGDFTNALLAANTNNSVAVADNIGRVYTAGYNAYGQLGDKSLKNANYLVGISHTSLEVKEAIITLDGIGAQKQIEAKVNLGFNILYNNLETETYTYKVLNKDIASIDQNGNVTALKYGSTSIEITNVETGNKAIVIVNVVRKGDIANPKVVAGIDYNVALKSDGTVWTWGYNNYGELGLGDNVRHLEPTKVNIEGVIDIAVGNHHTLLLKQDGTVWAMGLNNYGQLGNNNTTNTNLPVQVQNLKNIIRIEAGANHSVALKSDGTAYSWGYNAYGQLGDNTTTRRSLPVEVRRIKDIKEISVGRHSTAALDMDGNVWVWGLNTSGQLGLGNKTNVILPTKLTTITNVKQVELGTNYGIIVTEDKEVYSFGVNNVGQLGIGNKTAKTVPTKVMKEDGTALTNIEYVSAGTKHVIAKTQDGLAYGWGLDSNSQLGDEQTTNKLNPVEIKYDSTSDKITQVLEVAAGDTHSILVKEDGTVWTTGKNNYGQIGDDTTINRKAWVCISDIRIKVKETSITINKIGGEYNLSPVLGVGFNLLYNDGADGDFVYSSKDIKIAEVTQKGVITGNKRGKTKIGITETNTEKIIYVDVYVLEENDIAFPQVVTRGYTTVALKSDGTVWTWGQNSEGQLGLGDNNNRIAPTKVQIDNVVKIATSGTHTLALKKDGSVFAWGANSAGELGQGDTQSSNIPMQVKDETGTEMLKDIKEIETASQLSMAVTNDGKVYTWGLGTSGQIGIGTKVNKTLPTKTNGLSNITKIAGGDLSCYALTDEGEVYSWGANAKGQLGDGTVTLRPEPVIVPNLTGVIDVKASSTGQVLALKDDGTVWGWGYSTLGALTDVGGSIPKQLAGKDGRMKDISGISAGYYTGGAITDEGKVLAWGSNGYGALGNGTTTNSTIPTNVMENNTKELDQIFILAMGKNYSVYAKENGEVWAVGYNEYGQLGNSSTATIHMPENIASDYIGTQELELIYHGLEEQKQIHATYYSGFNLYNNETVQTINYSSQDETIAVVDQNGVVTSKGVGKTYIDITAGNLARRYEINVLKPEEIAVMDAKGGLRHTLAIKTNGTLWAFGDNSYGQLGLGNIESSNYQEPQEVKLPEGIKFSKIAVGYNHSLALDTNANVYSFGLNTAGQLGNNSNLNSGELVKVENLQNIVKIVAYKNTSYALNANGEVYAWGEGYTKEPTKLNFPAKVIDITGKLLLSEYGTVWEIQNLNKKISGLNNIVEIASGDSHNLALRADGTVYSLGYNGYGQCGTGNTTNINEAVAIENLQKIESVKAAGDTSYLLSTAGEVYSFGRNTKSSLGTGTKEASISKPTKIQSQMVHKISAGQNYGVYVNDEGFVYTWGNNNYGQLAQGEQEIITPSVIGSVKIVPEQSYITIQEGQSKEIGVTLNNTFNLRQDIIDSQGFTFETINGQIATMQGNTVTGVQSGITPSVISHNTSGKKAAVYIEVLKENAKSVIDVKAGEDFNIALKADGTAWSFGANTYGELALGNTANYNEPQPISLEARIRQIAVGNHHMLALTENGVVYAAGQNKNGQCGNGTDTNAKDLVEVLDENGKQIQNIVMITAKENTSYLLDKEGTVYACGNGYYKLATKLENITDKIIQISGNYGITIEKKVIDLTTGKQIENLNEIIKIAQGTNHVLFLSSNKTVYSMGTNTNGQCGTGTKTNVVVPTQVKNNIGNGILENVVEIAAGKNYSMAVLADGNVYTWGSNENHKLGQEQTNDQILPKKNSNIKDAVLVAAGSNHAIYVEKNGNVYAYGNGEKGNLGNGVDANSTIPVLVGSEEIVLNSNHITIKVDEQTDINAKIKSFNLYNHTKQEGLTYKSNDNEIITIDNTGKITGIKEGNASITVTQEGTQNKSIAQVTVIRKTAYINPQVKTTNSTQVILKADGTVWTYGAGSNGELGDGTDHANDNLNKVEFNQEVKIIEIAVGESHVLALDDKGNVWAWGANNYGQCSNSTNSNNNKPVKVALDEKIIKIAAGNNSSYAITKDNYLITWGLNTDGQCGVGNYDNTVAPTKVKTLKNVLEVKAGKSHAVVITTDGTVYATGNNSFGTVTGDDYKVNTFKEVKDLKDVVYLSAGEYHNIALNTQDEVYVWGYNVYGQLGTGDTNTTNKPTKIELQGAKQVEAGKSHTVILTKEGKLYSTGLNSLGQLGTTSSNNQVNYTLVDTIEEIYTIDSGNTYDIAVKQDGSVFAWGDYYHGVGTVTTNSNSRLPVQIGISHFYLQENDIAVNKDTSKKLNVNPQFEFNVFEENIANNDFSYSSLNEEIATVDENGNVTGKKVGTTWVKVIENTTKQEQIAIIRVIEPENKVAPKIAGGTNYAVALKADGSIWSFGYNSNGELGTADFVASNVPKEINILKSYTDISAGDNFTLMLMRDGSVWSVGDNQYGQLGQGDRTSHQAPTIISNLENVIKIAAGSKHGVALTKNGEVYTWGANTNGKLGLGNKETKDIPTKVNLPGITIVDIAAGEGYIALVDNNGEIYVSGKVASIESSIPVKLEKITPSVKVAGGKELMVLTKEGNVLLVSDTITQIYAGKDAVDISAKGNNYMILTNSGKLINYGVNTNGELGIENGANLSTATEIATNEKVISIGSGMNNTYYIAENGRVYACGNNQYGSLGNETTENSNTYTLVGKRKFTVKPDNILMSVNDILDLEVESSRYNVLKQDQRTKEDFEWTSNDTAVVTVEEAAKIKAIAEGETTLTIVQKDTGAKQEIKVVVEPLEAQRIEKLTVNNIDAKVVGIKQYEVIIATDDTTGNLLVTTKDKTDKISIDGGNTWYEQGSLIQTINLPAEETQIPIKVQTANGTEFDYTLTVIKQSNDTTLQSLTVNGEEATPTTGNNYSIILEDIDQVTIKAITTHQKAEVGIDSKEPVIHETTEDISIKDTLIRTVPIKVVAQSGKEVNYVLTIFKKSALTELESLTVDGVETTKNNYLNYSIVVEKDTKEVDIKAVALYDLAKVNIHNLGEEEKQTTRTITLNENETIVKIKVRVDEIEKEYTLTITKKVDSSSLAQLFVNGEKAVKISENNYEAVVAANSKTAEVLAIAAVNTSTVQIGTNAAQIGRSQVTVETNENNNVYTITITDAQDLSKTATYTLTIKKPSTDNSLKYITISNNEISVTAVRQEGTDIYKAKINEKYENLKILAVANYELSEVAIKDNNYQVKQDTLDIIFEEETASYLIKVKAQGGEEKTYTLVLEKQSSDTTLEYVKVNNAEAIKSEEKQDTYEITLTERQENVTVNVKTANSAAEVALNNVVYELNEIIKTIPMDAKEVTVKINVKAEDGTLKTYNLIIHSVPDNTKLTEILVNGVKATLGPYTNKYIARVPSNLTTYEVTAKAEDSKASVQIAQNAEEIAQSTQNIAKEQTAPTTTTIKVTAQDKESKETYYLEIVPRQTNTKLEYLKVEDNFVEKAEDGEYYVKVIQSKQTVNIEAKAADENAVVGIDEQGSKNIVTKQKDLTGNKTIFEIKVTAEDGNEQIYKLNVEKMSDDTSLVGIYVDGNIVTPIDGKYIAKIGNNNQAEVKVITTDKNATISIDGADDAVQEDTQVIDVAEEEKTIEITITAEDGSKKIYPLTLKKNSKDNTLLSITAKGIEDKQIVQTSETTYQMIVSNELEEVEVTAITSSKVANIKIENNEYEVNTQTKQINIPNDTTIVTITVKAESGEEKEYTLTIIKKYVLTLDSIVVDGEVITPAEDGSYTAWVDTASSQSQVIVTPTSSKANVIVENVVDHIGTTNFNVQTPEEETIVKIIVKSPVEEEQIEHTLKIRKKSSDTSLEYVKVEGQVGTEEEDGSYTVKVPVQNDNYHMEVKAANEYAYVKIENGEYALGAASLDIDLSTVNEKQVTVTVKAQNGTEKTYTVNIQKVSSDNTIKIVKVGNVEIQEENGIYKAFVKEDVTTANLYIETTNQGAKIQLGEDDEKIHTVTKDITMDQTEKTIGVKVTAEDGSVKQYSVVIAKESDDTGIQNVKVDEKGAIVVDEETYYITATPGAKEVTVEVTAANAYANVQINGSEKQVGKNTVKVSLPEGTKVVPVSIVITAQNGKDTKTYTLNIEQVSNNTNISKVQVNGKDVTTYDEETKTYTYIIDYTIDESTVYVQTENEQASVRIEAGALNKHEATEDVSTAGEENHITITVVAEDGSLETRMLNIKKLSQDATILKLYVNELAIEPDEDGNYTAEVLESILKSTVRIKTTNKDAQIQIDGEIMESKGEASKEYETANTRQLVILVKITAEDGITTKETTLTINVISDNKNLEYVKVNGKEVTTYDENTKTYKAFIPADSTQAEIEVKAQSSYAKLNIDSNEATAIINYTAQTQEDITYVYVDVIAEDDSVKTYIVELQKESTDNTLKELYKDNVVVDPEEDENYIINVAEETKEVTLKAVANNEYAQVAIGTQEAQIGESTSIITLAQEKTTIITITVTAQDNSQKTYTVTINKQSANNKLEYVKVNSEEITNYNEETKTYETFIPANSTSALIDIKTQDAYATVELLEVIGTQVVSVNSQTDAQETLVEVIVTSETGVSDTYYINLIKISTDATLKEIYVDGEQITPDGEGNYIAEVADEKVDAIVKAVANNQYAQVAIANGDAKQMQAQETVTLGQERVTNVIITTTSQSGKQEQTTLVIKKVSDDTRIHTVLVNGIECNNYDEKTKTYTAYIAQAVNQAEVAVMANSNNATLSIEEETAVGNITVTTQTVGEITKVIVNVVSETGKTAKYTINIVKESADASVEIIKVNDIEVQAPYNVTIKKLDNKAKIYVKATNSKAMVKIADETAQIGASEVTLEIPLEQDTIVVPVVITAQNGVDKQTYNITLRRNSNNTGIKQILVNGEEVDLTTLEHIVKNVNESEIVIIPEDENAVVMLDGNLPNAVVGKNTPGDKEETTNNGWKVDTKGTTIRTITVIAEDGTTKEYDLTLLKKITISGTITDENIVNKHIATIIVYQTADTRPETTLTDPNGIKQENQEASNTQGNTNEASVNQNVREIVSTVQTKEDGSYEIVLEPGIYDIVFVKPGYLKHRITNIDITKGKGAALEVVNLIAGDTVETNEIEIDDLVALNDNYGEIITDENKKAKEIYDFNGDGVVNKLDRNILKKNYGKKAVTQKWVDPDAKEEVVKVIANEEQENVTNVSINGVDTNKMQNFILPMKDNYTITSNYGMRVHPITGETKKHTGIDIVGAHHTEILAVAEGEVTFSGVQNGYGNCIEIKHTVNGETVYSFYAHLSKLNVQTGETVKQGEVIALEGGDPEKDPNPGNTTGHHLHFEIRTKSGYGNDTDPNNYIKF